MPACAVGPTGTSRRQVSASPSESAGLAVRRCSSPSPGRRCPGGRCRPARSAAGRGRRRRCRRRTPRRCRSGSAVPRSISAASPTRTASGNDVHHGWLVLSGSSRSRSISSASTVSVAACAGGCPPRAIQISIVGGSPITRGRAHLRARLRSGESIVICAVRPGDRRERARQPRRPLGADGGGERAPRPAPRRPSRGRCPPAARHIASTASSSTVDGELVVVRDRDGVGHDPHPQAPAPADDPGRRSGSPAGRAASTPIWGASRPTPPSRTSPRIRTRRGALTVSRARSAPLRRRARLGRRR